MHVVVIRSQIICVSPD